MNALTPGALEALQRPLTTLMSERPDAALLALRAELDAAVADMGAANTTKADDDDAMDQASSRLTAAVKAIGSAAPACTEEGRAIKAAAAMQELRMVFSEHHGDWPSDTERLMWNLLSDLAGDVYVPPAVPDTVRRRCEPPRLPFEPVFEASAAGLPDAELIRLCEEFIDLELAYDNAGRGVEFDSPEEAAAEAERERIVAAQDILVPRMWELPCTSLAGLRAIAKALAAWDRELLRDSPAEDQGGVLTALLVRRLLGVDARDDMSDADLLALRPEFDRLHALMIDFNSNVIPDGGTECAEFDALCRRIAMAPPAVTAKGSDFQTQAAMHDLTYRMSEGEEETCAVWRLLKGIAGGAFQSVEARS